jgi:ABC-type lipoprotein export system ATPase subunit
MALLEATSLGKVYGGEEGETPALRDVDLTVEEGEFVAITGPSGSGKSTLLHLLGCLDRPTNGRYSFAGQDVSRSSDRELAAVRNRAMGFIFQAFNLLPRASVLENVKLPLVYASVPEPERTARARAMVVEVGLSDRERYLARKLSGGQQQRVAIARALVNHPKIVFADEPTGSLDSKSGEVILGLLEDLNRRGHTVVLVTHESYVAAYAERLLHLKDGRLERDERQASPRTVAVDGFRR